jgi:hypothetical protein
MRKQAAKFQSAKPLMITLRFCLTSLRQENGTGYCHTNGDVRIFPGTPWGYSDDLTWFSLSANKVPPNSMINWYVPYWRVINRVYPILRHTNIGLTRKWDHFFFVEEMMINSDKLWQFVWDTHIYFVASLHENSNIQNWGFRSPKE